MNNFEEKKLFSVIFVPFQWFNQKRSFLSNQNISSRFFPFQTHWEKISFCVILSFLLRWSLFIHQREVFCLFPAKSFKTPETLSLAACGSICGAKFFRYYLSHFTYLTKKVIYFKSKPLLTISPFTDSLKNNNFLVILDLLLRVTTMN